VELPDSSKSLLYWCEPIPARDEGITSLSSPSNIISRAEAKALGLKRYFTGKPCKRGHVTERGVNGPGCMECTRERMRERRAANLEKAREMEREHSRKYRAADPERARENWRRWAAKQRTARAGSELNAGIAGASEGNS
jgi:hypothetical protein